MLHYEFMRNAMMAAFFVAILCPAVGVFLVLRRYSLMGDTLAHSSFAGISIGLILGFNPLISALAFTSLSGLLIETLRTYLSRFADLIMAIVLTLSVGIGITLVSTGKTAANINSYLFGSILTVSQEELLTIVVLSIVSLGILFIMYNKLVYITFDEENAKISGLNVKAINYLFILLVSATISVSIKIVGILVISSMIALPVATALQFKKGFKTTIIISVIVGVLDILSGLILSYYIDAAPGGFIALTSVVILIIFILLNRIFNLAKNI
ncbi:MAG: metal ABC transporter permease [Clostridiaceae bacterium]